MKSSLIKLGASLLATGVVSAGTVIVTTKVVEQHNYNLVHEINTTDVYTINGEEVSYEEWLSYLEELENGTNITSTPSNENTEEQTSGRQITYADSPNYLSQLHTVGTKFDYLAVYNCSDNTAGGCDDSYVLGCCSDGVMCEVSDLIGMGYYQTGQYRNLSCFNYKENEDYSQYIKDCTNRTSPGRYQDPITGNEMDWEDATYGIGAYVLTNATVQSVHASSLCTYGGQPLYQIIITYDKAYTPLQLASL